MSHVKNSFDQVHLDYLVYIFAEQQASDPRDHIYALLSLASESEARYIAPNYRETATEIYTDFTRVMMEKIERKSILKRFELNLQSEFDVPFWSQTGRLIH